MSRSFIKTLNYGLTALIVLFLLINPSPAKCGFTAFTVLSTIMMYLEDHGKSFKYIKQTQVACLIGMTVFLILELLGY